MNALRRKELAAVMSKLEELKAMIEEPQSELERLTEEENDYYNNMPEGIQMSERGERAETAIEALEEASGGLDDLIDSIDSIIDSIQEAIDA